MILFPHQAHCRCAKTSQSTQQCGCTSRWQLVVMVDRRRQDSRLFGILLFTRTRKMLAKRDMHTHNMGLHRGGLQFYQHKVNNVDDVLERVDGSCRVEHNAGLGSELLDLQHEHTRMRHSLQLQVNDSDHRLKIAQARSTY